MQIIYIYSRIEKDLKKSGEAKKATMQIDALRAHGLQTDIIYHDRTGRGNKLLARLPFWHLYSKKFIKSTLNQINDDTIGVYIRKDILDASFIQLLSKIREQKPEVKIVLEIPTFPYDLEWKNVKDFPMLIKDRIYRKYLCGYIDRIVVYGKEKEVYGIPCINSSNGIDMAKIPVRIPKVHTDKRIQLLGVAGLAKWHGYDRLLRGLSDYYGRQDNNYEVIFHIVGEGAEKSRLKKLAKKLNIEKYVVFHGSKKGKELDVLFDDCDIGIGSLGMHRIKMYDGYTLKLREYTARGIPYIYAYNDSLIENADVKYYIKFENDDSNIDVCSIVDFYQRIFKNMGEIAEYMSNIAGRYFPWTVHMEPIAKYFKEGKREIC